MKVLLNILLFFLIFTLNAQNDILKGNFTGEDLEKSFINVINVSQYKASISRLDGRFEIEAKVGDSILISSIQYSEIKFIVKPEFFKEGLEIPLKLKVNELEPVDLYSIGLTGNIERDINNIKTNKLIDYGKFDISNAYYEDVTTASEFSIRNVALEKSDVTRQIPMSVNFIGVFRKLNGRSGKKRRKGKIAPNLINQKTNKLKDMDFFVNVLKIKEEQIDQFIQYAKSRGLKDKMLKKNKEMDLIQFLIRITDDFKDLQAKN